MTCCPDTASLLASPRNLGKPTMMRWTPTTMRWSWRAQDPQLRLTL